MENLGDILARSNPMPNVPPASSASAQLLMPKPWEAERMQHLPPTAEIENLIVESKIAWDELRRHQPTSDALVQAVPLRTYNQWSGLIAWAYRRDRIQETRPAGCWCLGFGGMNPHYAPSDSSGTLAVIVTPKAGAFCSCPEGQAAGERTAALRATTQQARLAEIQAQAEIPRTMSGWSFASYPARSDEQVLARSRVETWAREGLAGQSLYLWGEPSIGKTGLAVAALRLRMQTTLTRGLFLDAATWMEDVRAANAPEIAADALDVARRAEIVSLLLLDDLGKEYETEYSRKVLFRVLNARHSERRVTIFTSNESPARISAQLGAWLMDRLTEMCGGGYWIVHIQGENLRAQPALGGVHGSSAE